MARRRMIDPNIWQSEDFAHLSILARLIFIGLFSNADDEGKGRAKPVYVKSVIFPYDEDVRVADIEKALSEISSKMSVTLYSHNGNAYYKMNNWKIWQRVDKPQKSKIPEPNDIPELVENHSGIIPESVEPKGKEENEKGKEVEGEEKNAREEERPPKPKPKKPKPDKKRYGEFNNVLLTDDERNKLSERFGTAKAEAYIERLSGYIESKGAKYQSHYATMLNWSRKDGESENGKTTPASKFNNFSEQEEYDFDRLEKAAMAKLLEEAGT